MASWTSPFRSLTDTFRMTNIGQPASVFHPSLILVPWGYPARLAAFSNLQFAWTFQSFSGPDFFSSYRTFRFTSHIYLNDTTRSLSAYMPATKGLSKKGESVSTITRLFPGDDSGGYNQHRCRGTDSSVVIECQTAKRRGCRWLQR